MRAHFAWLLLSACAPPDLDGSWRGFARCTEERGLVDNALALNALMLAGPEDGRTREVQLRIAVRGLLVSGLNRSNEVEGDLVLDARLTRQGPRGLRFEPDAAEADAGEGVVELFDLRGRLTDDDSIALQLRSAYQAEANYSVSTAFDVCTVPLSR